jgi:hypothetical protein
VFSRVVLVVEIASNSFFAVFLVNIFRGDVGKVSKFFASKINFMTSQLASQLQNTHIRYFGLITEAKKQNGRRI